jgi:predicted nuclease of predicted toxin-antitoxin system
MKILIDMNLSPIRTDFFISNNIDAVHWSAVGSATDPDTQIFEYARTNSYVVFTNDLDFGSILAANNANAPSVFQIRAQNLMPSVIGHAVVACLENYKPYLERGSLVTFLDEKAKVRILPLRG